jgi:hypothetical protein
MRTPSSFCASATVAARSVTLLARSATRAAAERGSVLAVARRFLSLGFLVPADSTVIEERS